MKAKRVMIHAKRFAEPGLFGIVMIIFGLWVTVPVLPYGTDLGAG